MNLLVPTDRDVVNVTHATGRAHCMVKSFGIPVFKNNCQNTILLCVGLYRELRTTPSTVIKPREQINICTSKTAL